MVRRKILEARNGRLVSRFKLPLVNFGGETLGQRIARIRKERGYTPVELATRIGIIQTIISAVESDDRKLSAEMAIRFAQGSGCDYGRSAATRWPQGYPQAFPQGSTPPGVD